MVNIFWLDWEIEKAVKYHPDRYTYNGIREMSQMMQSALVNNGVSVEDIPNNGVSHQNHPMTRWVGYNQTTWDITRGFLELLHEEYRFRYGQNKVHDSYKKIRDLDSVYLDVFRESDPPVPQPPQCFGGHSEYICDDYVEGYRFYFANVKYPQDWCRWEKGRPEPEWIEDYNGYVPKDVDVDIPLHLIE